MYTVIPKFGYPHCHIFDSSNTKQVGPKDSIEDRPITDIIVHHTAGDLLSTVKIFTSGEDPHVNAHYIVTETGEIIQMADPKYVVRHAGLSKFREKERYNLFSIGIEMVNGGFETNKANEIIKLIEYPEVQTNSAFNLIKYLCDKFKIKENVLGHADVAPGRKSDPTSMFLWRVLWEKYGLGRGVFDNEVKKAEEILDSKVCLRSGCEKRCFDRTFYALLRYFGYDVPEDAVSKDINHYKKFLDNPVMAFLFHFSRNGQGIEQLNEPLAWNDLCYLYALCQKYPIGNNQNIDPLIKSCQ